MRKEWLAMMTGCLLASSSSATVISGGIDYPSIWACEEAKFHWYCDVEPEPTPDTTNPGAKAKTSEEAALEELERLRKALEAKRALALMQTSRPTLRRRKP